MTKTKTGRRLAVEIAKDVLARLGALHIVTGTYFGSGSTNMTASRRAVKAAAKDEDFVDAQPFVANMARTCSMCARGALFLGFIAVHNKIDLRGILCRDGTYYTDSATITKTVAEAFDPDQLSEIESRFEAWSCRQEWGTLRPKERLRRICLNIVHNKGVFDPSTQLEKFFLLESD